MHPGTALYGQLLSSGRCRSPYPELPGAMPVHDVALGAVQPGLESGEILCPSQSVPPRCTSPAHPPDNFPSPASKQTGNSAP